MFVTKVKFGTDHENLVSDRETDSFSTPATELTQSSESEYFTSDISIDIHSPGPTIAKISVY